MEIELTTEQKIKEAAREIFMKQGLAGARTKDIADAAGINLALLNYYFRSKEKLFDIIMKESLAEFFADIAMVLNNTEATLGQKIDMLVDKYTDLLIDKPFLPLFVFRELNSAPIILDEMGITRDFINNSHLMQQLHEHFEKNKQLTFNSFHAVWNVLSMTVFPFISKNVFSNIANLNDEQMNELLNERRKLIPMWIKTILNINE